MRSRSLLIGLWLIAIAAALVMPQAVHAGSQAKGMKNIRFTFDWVPYSKYNGFYVALEKGWYKARGLNVRLLPGRGSGNTATRIATGNTEMGFTDPTSIVLGRARGQDLRMVAMVDDKAFHVIFALKSSGIRTPKDLEGKSISVPAGTALEVAWPAFLQATGLKNYQQVNIEGKVQNTSLLAGRVDAITSFATVQVPLRLMAKKKKDDINVILWSDYGVKITSDGIVTTDRYIAQNPKAVRDFVKASLDGFAWSINNPDAAVKILVKHVPTANPMINKGFWKVVQDHMLTPIIKEKGLGYIDPAKMKYTRDLMARAHKLKKNVKVEDMYTHKFLPDPLPKPWAK
ncbi:MAG: ABC transporter substrate-binding protein [Nitrospinota bacterium]